MLRLAQVVVTLLLAVHAVAIAGGGDVVPRKSKPLGVGIRMMDGGLLGSFHLEQVKAVDPSLLSLPNFYYVRYVWDGTHLQVHPGEDDKREWSKEAIAKDGWYVTADYSTKPPRAILTKEPNKDSRWRFVEASRPTHYYIKNENNRGKDAWLNLEEDTSKRYSLVDKSLSDAQGNRPNRYWEGSVYKAILSFGKKKEFFVNDIEDDGGR